MSRVLIDIRRKSYPAGDGVGEHVAIRKLRIVLNCGEFVCLVGPSGCGKTTLLNIVAGLDRQFDGTIEMEEGRGVFDLPPPKTRSPLTPNSLKSVPGRLETSAVSATPRPEREGLERDSVSLNSTGDKLDSRSSEDRRESRIGYVFQNPRLLPWRTVRENVDLALPHGGSGDMVDHLLEVMGLSQVQNQYPERLSLGMSRRVALVRAFAIRPSLLLMDEPFVSLDAPTARRVRQLLIQVWQERPHTVLFVTHDLREAITLADRVIFLSSPPTSVLHEVTVSIPRTERDDEAAIETFRGRLIAEHPEVSSLL